MAAIDTRSKVTCNLGEVISGGVSDSYAQGSGLIFTRGQIMLKSVKTPAAGTIVRIYVEGSQGGMKELKRNLRVLSSFADPLAGTTEVSIGCDLTYQQGNMPAPGADGDAGYLTPNQLQCLNGLPSSAFTPPMMAADVFKYCVETIGVGNGDLNLINPYVMDKFDLSSGFVSAISDLLLSESRIGFMSENGRLITKDANQRPSGEVRVSVDDVISISSINSGELAPDGVVCPYIDKKLKRYEPEEARWDEVTTQENVVSQRIDYEGGSITANHIPTVKSVTEYGTGPSLTDQCKINANGFGDLSDKPIRSTNTRTTSLGVASPGYASAMLTGGQGVDINRQGELKTIQTTEYDAQDRPALVVTADYEPMFVYAGRLSLPWVLDGSSISLGSEPVLVQEVREEVEYVGENSVPSGAKPDQNVPDPVVFERRIKRVYQASGRTQGGSQGSAEATTGESFTTPGDVLSHINGSKGMVLVDVEITMQRRYAPQGQSRPGASDRGVAAGTIDNGGRTTKYLEIGFGGNSGRIVQYRPPLLPESYHAPGGAPIHFDTQSVAAKFARTQHQMAVGNRLGINIQGPFDLFNVPPLTAISLSMSGFSARYKTNGIGFTWDANGAVSSCDALYMGAEGILTTYFADDSDAVPWFILPPNYPVDQLPAASDGQLIPPFKETLNLNGGIAIGVRASSEKSLVLEKRTVSLGVAIGVDGTNGTIKHVQSLGVAIGPNVISFPGPIKTIETGVKIGVNVLPVARKSTIVKTGIKVGINEGPSSIPPLLLLNFDTDFSDSSSNNWPVVDAGSGEIAIDIIPSDPENYPSRFGAGFCYRSEAAVATKMYEFNPAQSWGLTWTIEFWLRLFPNDPYNNPPTYANIMQAGQEVMLFGFVGTDRRSRFYFKGQELGDAPWLEYREGAQSGNTYEYPPISTPTGQRLPQDEQWVHVAVVAEGDSVEFGNNALCIYQNGLRVAAGINSAFPDDGTLSKFVIGASFDAITEEPTVNGATLLWLMDELRVVPGKAVYTGSSFTPPTGPF